MEIEIKAKVIRFEEVKRRLLTMGAEYSGKMRQRDIYFNHPARDFRKTDEALRVRYSAERTFITYKGPKVDKGTKSREEMEFEISEGRKAEKILEKLGFRVAGEVCKLRELYFLEDVKVALDDVENLGFFVELEIMGEYTEKNLSRLFDTAQKLGLDTFIRKSYLEMLLKNEK